MRSRPVPAITSAGPSFAMRAPSAVIARAERPLSAPSPSPSTRIGVSESNENRSARCPIDLSPGTVTVPDRGPRWGSTISFTASASRRGTADASAELRDALALAEQCLRALDDAGELARRHLDDGAHPAALHHHVRLRQVVRQAERAHDRL